MFEEIGKLRSLRPWRTGHAKLLLAQVLDTDANARSDLSDDDYLIAAAKWLAAAQDAARDGGIAGRYKLATGWSSSYPETTGYAVPTLLKLADYLGDASYRARAGRAIDFLLSVQL